MPSSPQDDYSTTDIAATLLAFYQFLTTLHYDAKHLKIPPPEGWPGLDPLLDYLGRSEKVGEVMKHIPYFHNDCKSNIHYKSRLVDYPTLPRDCFEDVMDWRLNSDNRTWSTRRETFVDFYDFFPLALGRETWGRHMWLNVRDGEIMQEDNKVQDVEPVDLREYLNGLKQAYINLDLIPCRGKLIFEVIDFNELPEGQRVTEDEVIAQQGDWGTDLDIHYVKQLYRDCGWPDAFRRDEAFDAVDAIMDKIRDHRYEWETDDFDGGGEGHWC
ncbi:uncharacterized protein B0J16DRAFT_356360 [Fusarium flagelliforme]|uniref:Uncharacterized protein n=1 Tax=Fusarium flagelliforme TaxID=2675880 RepID=A0A395MXG1_9HYPO|nr:uncharacterized protein B0J16DRAFT_356360 [Fusarium flagelliforme]KAH7182357.1 hypothetical protein B0J16DRAFT_356360 [Fusarium flagelliforme]RFN52417.1 hypothetical protein FIE12Z_3348 [Fusarium flagelliforme]